MNSLHGTGESLECLARAAVGDDDAFERLVRRCYERIHRWALVATADPDDADDVAQDTLVRMHRSIASYGRDANFTSWLYRITHSAAVDHRRSRAARLRKRLRLSLYSDRSQEEPPAIESGIERKQQVALVHAFWKELPVGQQKVFDLVDLQGHAPAEVAEMLEMNGATVRAHLFKARRTIRTRILEAAPGKLEEEMI